MKRSVIDFLRYKPAELGFGTSGLRGLVTDMTDLEVYINTLGFVRFLIAECAVQPGSVVSLAGDLRQSTPKIMIAVAKAVEDGGLSVENCGFIPTPAVAAWAMNNKQASIMVTGSHIPADRNGVKFYTPDGEVLKEDEQAIQEYVAAVRKEVYEQIFSESLFNDRGEFKSAVTLPEERFEPESFYIERFTNFFNKDALHGKKIVVYQHSAVGRDILCELLELLGSQVIAVERSEVFVPIDTENVTKDNKALFKRLAKENPGLFAIVSTDGDSDRPFVIDENGEFYRGDVLGAVVAEYIGAKAAAVPISSSDVVDTFLKDKMTVSKTKIGSPYVIREMQRIAGQGVKPVVGWEVNGGFMSGSEIKLGDKIISALPTRDAFFPILCVLIGAASANIKVSEMFGRLPSRFTDAGLIDNFPQETSAKIITVLSGDKAKAIIGSVLDSRYGFSGIKEINTIDGIRITFDNHEIMHIRASGNAPQLRVYSVADSQARATEIVDLSVTGENNLIQQIVAKL